MDTNKVLRFLGIERHHETLVCDLLGCELIKQLFFDEPLVIERDDQERYTITLTCDEFKIAERLLYFREFLGEAYE